MQVLTLTKYQRQDAGEKYNLADAYNDYVNVVRAQASSQSGDGNHEDTRTFRIVSGLPQTDNAGVVDFSLGLGAEYDDVVIRVPMPRRSLLVLYGHARYNFEHAVLREDIMDRRICLAYREFTPPFLEGGKWWESDGRVVVERAKNFFTQPAGN